MVTAQANCSGNWRYRPTGRVQSVPSSLAFINAGRLTVPDFGDTA